MAATLCRSGKIPNLIQNLKVLSVSFSTCTPKALDDNLTHTGQKFDENDRRLARFVAGKEKQEEQKTLHSYEEQLNTMNEQLANLNKTLTALKHEIDALKQAGGKKLIITILYGSEEKIEAVKLKLDEMWITNGQEILRNALEQEQAHCFRSYSSGVVFYSLTSNC